MTIKEAQPKYYANRKELVDHIRVLYKQKQDAESRYKVTGDTKFSEEAATLELSLSATEKAFEENQKVVDGLMEQWSAACNLESSKQAGDAMADEARNMGKILTVFRRLAHGDIVPQSDERKLMEYDDKMYKVAKNMQMMAQQLEKERKKHKSLWDDEEEKPRDNPEEVADNTEVAGTLPEIEIPAMPDSCGEEIAE